MQRNDIPSPQQRQVEQHIGRVIAPHAISYPDPLAVKAGDTVSLTGKVDQWNNKPEWTFLWCVDQRGKDGWVPQEHIEQQGATGIMLYDYDCVELAVAVGETVTMAATVSGWVWCANQHGQSGWVPLECLRSLP